MVLCHQCCYKCIRKFIGKYFKTCIFAKLFQKVLPVAKSAAKGIIKIAAPHAKGFLGDITKQGLNQGVQALTNLQKRKRDNLDNE